MTKVTAEKILLGHGVIMVGTVPLGLTRGGGSFVVEREYREIEADGDRGPVEGRIIIDREVAKLTVNALELFASSEIQKYYPALAVDTVTSTTEDTITSTLTIAAGDYSPVTWTGKTKDGKSAVIALENALNMANLEWGLEDKAETVPSLEFTATYKEASRGTPPWNVKLGKTA